MKLYTEKQIIKAIKFDYSYIDTMSKDDYINTLTPIELPSDEYIDEVFQPMTELHQYYKDGFINGAKWMKEQILNQDK